MILVFFILGIIILISLVILILSLSNIKLEIKKLHITNESKKLKLKFVFNISIYFLDKIKIFNVNIDNYKIRNLLKSGNIDIKKINTNKNVNKYIIKILKTTDFVIEKLDINGYFATFDTVITSSIYGILNIIIPILIAPRIKNRNYINNIKFLNINSNIININISCIINVKNVNIINILYSLKKKGGKQKNGKSSNRSTYAYSNE